ncbi:MAG TPA: FYDLN acid domain-containing protein [Thermoanaerobaculia bacterium]|nr:FYDLN acid domain-containing protein [Thermoanaerobaculia bacterium]
MAELGNKFECSECGTKFYDLGNPHAVCPKCGTAPSRNTNEIERRAPLPRIREVEEEEEVVATAGEDEVVDAADETEEVVDAGDDD